MCPDGRAKAETEIPPEDLFHTLDFFVRQKNRIIHLNIYFNSFN